MSSNLRQWRYQRGLFIKLEGGSIWGLGKVLPNVFILHEICRLLCRFCYVEAWDMKLHKLMGYASDDLSWGPPEGWEIAKYLRSPGTGTSSRREPLQLNLGHVSVFKNFGTWLKQELMKAPYADAPYVEVRTACPPRFSFRLFFAPVLNDLLPSIEASSAPAVGALAGKPSGGSKAAEPNQTRMSGGSFGLQPPSRCFMRFVTEPVFDVLAFTKLHRPARTALHLRTGYADIQDNVLDGLSSKAVDSHTMMHWLDTACPSVATLKPEDRRARHYLLSDATELRKFWNGEDSETSNQLQSSRSWGDSSLQSKRRTMQSRFDLSSRPLWVRRQHFCTQCTRSRDIISDRFPVARGVR